MSTAAATAPRHAANVLPPPQGKQVAACDDRASAVDQPRPMRLGEELKSRESQFKAALPAHIPLERFMRVVMTAVQRNADLAQADRASLFTSAMQAAQDGLLPDGREGALVIYNSKAKTRGDDGREKEVWIKMVQWMPMVAGIRKKVRNSGEIATWEVQVVHANDDFEFELGDDPFVKHRPCLNGDPGPVIAAYSIATLKSGEKSREVMTKAQIDKVRSVSKSKDRGPWVDWYEEMCRKAVARRHSKVLPMSTDLDDLIRRDDDLYDLKGAREEAVLANGGRPQSLAGRLDVLADMSGRESAPAVERDDATGEVIRPGASPGAGAALRSKADGGAEDQGSAEAHDQVELGASPDADAPDPDKIALLERLRPKARKGTNALRLALRGLIEADEARLNDKDHDELGAIAEEADRDRAHADG